MYRKIVVSYNESPEAQHALTSAIRLARSLGSELHAMTVMAELPVYTAFAAAADAALPRILAQDRETFYKQLAEKARATAAHAGLELRTHVKVGSAVETILQFVRDCDADLLVVGLHQRDLYVARLWSTVYELAQKAPCSVLGVHAA